MQDALNEIEGVKAELNFAAGTLILEIQESSMEEFVIKRILQLEPEVQIVSTEEATEEENEEGRGRELIKKITLSGFFFVTGLIIDYYFFPGVRNAGAVTSGFWIVFFPYLVAYIISGHDVLEGAVKGIRRLDFFSENFLMSIATIGAFLIGEFPEAAGVMLFFKVGEYFEDRAVGHSRRSIKSLLKIRADYANLYRDGESIQVSPRDVKVGDIILIKPGERVPLDGEVIQGETTADTSALTGESVPRRLGVGDTVLSGMVNQGGVILVRVSRAYEQSTVSRILELVERAASEKAQTERFITRFSRVYTPVVVSLAIAMAVLPPLLYHTKLFIPLFSHVQTYQEWIYRSLVFLVISCPCALVLSIPVAFFGGIGAASRRGVLFKGANHLEAFRKVHTVVFDKTGTLTEGVFKVVDIKPFNGFTSDELLRLAALSEAHSNHPIAKSILDAYGGSIDEGSIQSYEEIPSYGVRVIADGREIVAGNDRILHLDENNIQHDNCVTEGTVVHVALDKRYAGYIVLSDVIREDAAKT
ncbi:MAG: heavy metal translocating P-type ATPase, partial [Nitrospirae bacterium]